MRSIFVEQLLVSSYVTRLIGVCLVFARHEVKLYHNWTFVPTTVRATT